MEDASTEDPHDGRLIGGRYRLEVPLGEGASGLVWRARHQALGRSFALKLLRPDAAVDPSSRARFIREAKALGRLRHPHIVAVTDFGFDEPNGVPYLVMEQAGGEALSTRLEKGRMPPAEALPLLHAIAAAVDAAHEAGVLHRDLKPANVVLSNGAEGGVVKVLDFGLAQLAAPAPPDGASPPLAAASGEAAEAGLTEPGMLLGTPLYLAPELIGDPRMASRASDVYAFAALAYEVLAGRPPFAGSTREVLRAHLNDPPPAAPAGSPGVPEGVWDALRQGLAKDAAARPRAAADLVGRIEAALARAEAARRDRRRRAQGAGWASAVTLAATLLALGPLRPGLAALERRAVDLRFRLAAPRPPDPRLLILALDDTAGVGGASSLADAADVIAPVLDQALSAGARGVAIDILLPRKWGESERFSELLLRHRERITLAAYSGEGRAVIGLDGVAGLTAAALGPAHTAALFGFVNLSEDADGVTRRAQATFRDVAGRSWPSWAAAAARPLGPHPGRPHPEPFWIDHRARVEDVPQLRWAEASGLAATRPEVFRDRLVLLGVASPVSGDDLHRVPRPSASVRGVAGLGLQALVVDTMARGCPVREASPAAFLAAAVAAAGALAGALLCYGGARWALSIAAAAVPAYIWTAIAVLDRKGLLIPLAPPIAVLALGLLLSAGVRAWTRRRS